MYNVYKMMKMTAATLKLVFLKLDNITDGVDVDLRYLYYRITFVSNDISCVDIQN